MKDFVFGTATAAYQIEGAYEKDGRGLSVWDTFSHTKGKTEKGQTGDIACDHYHRWENDFDLLKDLGVDAYRFSISWSRILPEGIGKVNYKGVDFYKRLVDGLLKRNVTPWCTLFHWDLPQKLQDIGGFANRDILGWFSEYTELFLNEISDGIDNICVVNEPCVYATHGHVKGVHAPGLKDFKAYNATVHHLNLVMASAYRQIKSFSKDKNVGSTYCYTVTEPATKSEKDILAAEIAEAYEHGNYFEPLFNGKYPNISSKDIEPFVRDGDMNTIKNQYDYIGIQHYMPFYARYDENEALNVNRDFTHTKPDLPRNSFGWTVEPVVFYNALKNMKDKYNNPPLFITENGTAWYDKLDTDGRVHDSFRIEYLENYISEMFKAKEHGVDIRGYFEWSLLDNYEWAAGYDQRFGLIYVDYEDDLKRIPKDSFYWYKKFIKNYKEHTLTKKAS